MSLALKIAPPALLIISVILMLSLAYYFPQYSFSLALSTPLITVVIALAGIISLLALIDFRKHKTTYHPQTPEKTSTVVDSGIYAYSRNPMYLALVLILLALALCFKNLTCFGVIPLFIGYITQYQIKPEEVMLNKLFPTDYQVYSQKVRRWL
jgi:protein-S-isoprenylcysteine O-methyltransferase Ste14